MIVGVPNECSVCGPARTSEDQEPYRRLAGLQEKVEAYPAALAAAGVPTQRLYRLRVPVPGWPRVPVEQVAEGWLIGDFAWRWTEEDGVRGYLAEASTVLLTERPRTALYARTPSIIGAGEYVSPLVRRAVWERHRRTDYLLIDRSGTSRSYWGSGHLIDWAGLAAAVEALLRQA